MKIITVAGARPNFIKIAPLHRAFLKKADRFDHMICHTGQHFDANMSAVFYEEVRPPMISVVVLVPGLAVTRGDEGQHAAVYVVPPERR